MCTSWYLYAQLCRIYDECYCTIHYYLSLDLANGSFGSGTDWVKFRSGHVRVKWHFGLDRVWFSSGRFRVNQFLVKYARPAKTNNFVEYFGSDMVHFRVSIFRMSGQIWVRVIQFEFRVSDQFCQIYLSCPRGGGIIMSMTCNLTILINITFPTLSGINWCLPKPISMWTQVTSEFKMTGFVLETVNICLTATYFLNWLYWTNKL